MFKYEMHTHTSQCSKCAQVNIEKLVSGLKERGYSGVVITNHFYRGNTSVNRKLPWDEFVGAYENDWKIGKALGEQLDFDVIFGLEECYLPNIAKEVLIYGITPEELKTVPDFKHYSLEQIAKFVRLSGGFTAAAHPFRIGQYNPEPTFIPDHRFFDGVELNFGHSENRNNMAEKFAEKHGLRLISGSDIHNISEPQFGLTGIATEIRIKDTKQMAKVLHSGDYKLIINGEIRQK